MSLQFHRSPNALDIGISRGMFLNLVGNRWLRGSPASQFTKASIASRNISRMAWRMHRRARAAMLAAFLACGVPLFAWPPFFTIRARHCLRFLANLHDYENPIVMQVRSAVSIVCGGLRFHWFLSNADSWRAITWPSVVHRRKKPGSVGRTICAVS